MLAGRTFLVCRASVAGPQLELHPLERDTTVGHMPQLSKSSDLRCAACGYLLRGLHVDATCPECGKPLSESAPPPYLTSWGVNDPRPCRDVCYGVGGVVRLTLAVIVVALLVLFILGPAHS